jgi:ferritin
MLSQKLQDALNVQINKELQSEYIYLSMEAYMLENDLDGIANFFHVQTQEEHFHAMKLYNFVIDRGGKVVLKKLDAPPVEFKSVIDVYEQTLAHEQFISKSINDLMDIAITEGDHAVISFLKWYVDEQVEEEANVTKILSKLKLIGGEGHGMLMIDSELALRVFTPPAAAGAGTAA